MSFVELTGELVLIKDIDMETIGTERVGLAMIGCGQIAKAHFRAIANVPEARLVAVMDVVKEKTQAAADEYSAKLYKSVEAVLADDSVDAVVLPLPHHLHCPVTIEASQAGKHILVEKPMALNLAEARQMVDAAEAAGVHLMVGQSTRFRPEVWAAKGVIDSGELGRIQQCIHRRAWFTKKLSTEWRYSGEQCGGLYLPIFGSHDVDMILWLMDAIPIRIYSLLRSHTQLVDAESDGTLNMELAGGGIASVTFSMTSHINRQNTLLIGTDGTLLIEGGKLSKAVSQSVEEVPLDKSQDAFTRQMREFVEAIRMDRKPVPSGRDVLTTMAVLDAAKESSATKSIIEIDG